MNHFRNILIIISFLPAKMHGQLPGETKKLIGRTFISNKLDYLEFINDTILYASFNSYNDSALFTIKNDTLSIQQAYSWTDNTGSGNTIEYNQFKIKYSKKDTISLQNISYKYSSKEKKTILFFNRENLKESITGFKYLKVYCSSPWFGEKKITINSSGRVIVYNNPFIKKQITIRGWLTVEELIKFRNLLSNSLLSRLPLKRGCPIDGGVSDFEILVGTKLYVSKGCDLSLPHQFLLNYIYTIDKNRGLSKN
jgi:hypothetical protein